MAVAWGTNSACHSRIAAVVNKEKSHSVVSDLCSPMDCPWNSPGQNTGVSSLTLLQGIFPAQGWNPGLPHRRQIPYQLIHQGSCLVSSVLTLCLQPCPSWGTAPEANHFQENGACADQVECWFGALGNYHCSRDSALPFSPDSQRSQETFTSPVGFLAHQRLCVVRPHSRGGEESALLIPHHSHLGPWALHHRNGTFPGSTQGLPGTYHSGNALLLSYRTSPGNLGDLSLAAPRTGLMEDRFYQSCLVGAGQRLCSSQLDALLGRLRSERPPRVPGLASEGSSVAAPEDKAVCKDCAGNSCRSWLTHF